ncbi:hypothetical protein CEXT_765171 [Caerostris extrusa]|uniref:Ycf2 n=1 Tax=Caerostris extrusa TaxID=172846 RepID=A0AAV4M5B9_CAEEX|nr:hypothetical protein CEXT_765171 [Caerostris extrusa]
MWLHYCFSNCTEKDHLLRGTSKKDLFCDIRLLIQKEKARSISSRDNDLKPRIQMNKWFTMSPSRSESSHNLTLGSQNSRLQTRHLSLEKQESFFFL